jgi:DNA-binding MarR family transcriptional regulator
MIDMYEGEEQPLGYLVHRIMSELRPAVTTALRPLQLGLPEFVCLRILSLSPGRSNAELARDTNVSPQAMNNVLRNLQDRGVIARPASVSSGRALPAQLTAKGKALLKRAEDAVHVADQRVLSNLTQAEQRQLKRLLAAASGNIGGPAITSP